jgi:hypothetical protein
LVLKVFIRESCFPNVSVASRCFTSKLGHDLYGLYCCHHIHCIFHRSAGDNPVLAVLLCAVPAFKDLMMEFWAVTYFEALSIFACKGSPRQTWYATRDDILLHCGKWKPPHTCGIPRSAILSQSVYCVSTSVYRAQSVDRPISQR